jgi:hypothetical protein
MRCYLFCITLVFLASLVIDRANAQDIKGSHWQIIRKDSSTISVKKLKRVKQDTLIVSTKSILTRVPIDSIITLIHVKRGNVGTNGTIGAGVGFAVGAVLGAVTASSYEVSPVEAAFGFGLVFAVPGLIIGAVSGALNNPEKVYDLHQLTLSQKSREIDKHCGN